MFPRRNDPLSRVLVLAMLASAALWFMGRRASRTAAEPPERAPSTPPGETMPRVAPPRGPSALDEGAACPRAGYLCADLRESGRVRVQRWRDFEGPMVVRVPEPALPDRALAERLQRAASAGVRAWNGQPFPVLVDERGTRPAQVEVRWVTRLQGTQIGLATTLWNPRSGLSVISLQLVTQYPSGAPMDAAQMRLVAAHEMGHALGLPHSDDPHDVMYPTNTATALSARDYRTVEALYRIEDGTEIVSPSRR